ncbi:TolC family protein [Saprospira grandis]|uniref:TolC family protein n=1 Tax=Saprospira grandis TaxID=1008 RepID=UPI0022DE232B|nr:TolC family protein [Saprospira grandis]WBM74906.1 TolC family protein [Saprospira grandis]
MKKLMFSFFLFWAVLPIRAQEFIPQEFWGLWEATAKRDAGLKSFDLSQEQILLQDKALRYRFLPNLELNASYTRLGEDLRFDSDMESLLMGSQSLLAKEALGIPFNMPLPEQVPLSEIPPILERNILKASADMNWLLYSGGKIKQGRKALQAKGELQLAQKQMQKETLFNNLLQTYDQLGLLLAAEKVLSQTGDYLAQQENFVEKAIANGLAIPIDRKKIELAKKQLALKVEEQKSKKKIVLALLAQQSQLPAEELANLHPQLVLPAEKNWSSEKRVELNALEAAQKALEAQEKMERQSFIPKLALKGHYEILQQDLSLLDPKAYIALGMNWTLFDGRQGHLKAEQKALEQQKIKEKIREVEEQLLLAETKAQADWDLAQEKIELQKAEKKLAEEHYALVQEQYQNGLTDLREPLAALKDIEQISFSLAQSRYQARRAYLALIQAKGQLIKTIEQQ